MCMCAHNRQPIGSADIDDFAGMILVCLAIFIIKFFSHKFAPLMGKKKLKFSITKKDKKRKKKKSWLRAEVTSIQENTVPKPKFGLFLSISFHPSFPPPPPLFFNPLSPSPSLFSLSYYSFSILLSLPSSYFLYPLFHFFFFFPDLIFSFLLFFIPTPFILNIFFVTI